MRSPVIPAGKISLVCELLLEGANPAAVEPFAETIGDGPSELDVDAIDDLSQELRDRHEALRAGPGSPDPDEFEGQLGARVHSLLTQLGVDETALDSPGFWAYLSTRYFWWFVAWRHRITITSGNYSKFRTYVDGTSPAECVMLRAYLRARLVHEPGAEDPYQLASAVPKGADFWRSHVLRVKTGTSPALTRALTEHQVSDRMATDDLRRLAKKLNRTWSNVVLHVYDDEDARSLLRDLAD